MKKNTLSEEYRRMSKLAGIPITEQVERDLQAPKKTFTKSEKRYVKGVNKSAEQGLRTFIKGEILEELKREASKNARIQEAKKKKKSKEEPIEEPVEDINIEEPAMDTAELDMDVTDQGFGDDMSMGGGSGDTKKMFGKLTDAFEAAKEFGDEKLTQQMANTIKYFNDNVILNTGR